jgi:hypothetical protein
MANCMHVNFFLSYHKLMKKAIVYLMQAKKYGIYKNFLCLIYAAEC